ncbi:MAG: hypothetical protein LBB05_03245 [Puniceicoccales bacterium]|nr:hypothetical protein [Puniceicoccales bacterium]
MSRKFFIQLCLLPLLFANSLLSQESLFLRAKGECWTVEDDGTSRRFQTRDNEEGETGKAISIANPTYDLTFKSLFTPTDSKLIPEELGDQIHSNKRLMSLLNSIIYPDAVDNPDSERIIAVAFEW